MMYLKWTEDLDIGIGVIDGQHRRIVDMINKLHDVQLASDRDAVGQVIEELVDYTISHFAFEEAMLEEAGYVFTKAHKRVHEVFIRRVSDYQLKFNGGEDVSGELKGMLGRWLFSHIRNDDQHYVEAVAKNLRELSSDRSEAGWLTRATRNFFRVV